MIAIIRREDEPKPVLMKKFKLSDMQAEAILNLRLRNLAKLEEMKIRDEQDELNEERATLDKTLGSAARLKTLIKKEILEDADPVSFVPARTGFDNLLEPKPIIKKRGRPRKK